MGQYFDNDKLPSNIHKYDTIIRNSKMTFFLDNGVFSKDKIDFGTRLLLETISLDDIYGDVLDIGCGYGPIGLFIAKETNSKVDMCDVNKRALHLALLASKFNKIKNVNIFESNCYSNIPDYKKYDVIITNPPIRAGKKIVYEIVMGAKNYLKNGGKLFLVIRKDQGAKSMIYDLEKIYNVTILEKSKGFFIIRCNFD